MSASPAEIDMQSFECCGLSPSGTAPEPWEKEEIAACIWFSLNMLVEW